MMEDWNWSEFYQTICYALSGIVAFVGTINVYDKMNDEASKEVVRSIITTVAVFVALIAVACLLG